MRRKRSFSKTLKIKTIVSYKRNFIITLTLMVEASHGPTDAEKHLQPAVDSRLSPIRHTPLLLGKTTDGRHLFLHETILTSDPDLRYRNP